MAHRIPLVPIPPMSGTRDMSLSKRINLPTWMVSEKVFMAEEATTASTDGDGEGNDQIPGAAANPVVALEVSYKDTGGEPTGLTLVYRDGGREATLGARGKRPQRLELLPGEALTRMEIGLGRGNRVACLTVSYIDPLPPTLCTSVHVTHLATAVGVITGEACLLTARRRSSARTPVVSCGSRMRPEQRPEWVPEGSTPPRSSCTPRRCTSSP